MNLNPTEYFDKLDEEAQKLSELNDKAVLLTDVVKQARMYADVIIPQMTLTRAIADEIEPYLGEKYKPYPSYADLLFKV